MRRAQFPFPMDYDRKKMTASLRLVGNTAGKNTLHLINGEGWSSCRRCYIIRDVLMQNRWSNRHCYRGRQVEEGPCKSLIIIRLCCLRAKTCLARTCRYLAVVYYRVAVEQRSILVKSSMGQIDWLNCLQKFLDRQKVGIIHRLSGYLLKWTVIMMVDLRNTVGPAARHASIQRWAEM